MKVLGVCMGMVCCLGLTSAWAFEQASENILDKRLTLYGGAQAYQADGKFGFIEEGQPDVKLTWMTLVWMRMRSALSLEGLLISEGNGPCV